jgi:hypothetical protein
VSFDGSKCGMPAHHAACSCGQLTLVAHCDPVGVSMCHCLACQRRTGSTYGAQARFPTHQVEVAGESTEYVRIGDEGNACHFHFCPRCGATVVYFFDDAFRVVPVGAFADPTFAPPGVSVYEERRHPWVSVPEGAKLIW